MSLPVLLLLCVTAAAGSVLDDVDVFIGSGGLGFGAGSMSPAAQVPFGAARVGPDTSFGNLPVGFEHISGYHFGDTRIRAFSHTRLVGAGVPDFGSFGLIPHTGSMFQPPKSPPRPLWRGHGFAHEHEAAGPGWYSVTLNPTSYDRSERIHVELAAAGPFSSLHRYTFAASAPTRRVLLDVCHTASIKGPGVCRDASVRVTPLPSGAVRVEAAYMLSDSLSGRSPIGGMPLYATMEMAACPSGAASCVAGADAAWPRTSAAAPSALGVWADGVLSMQALNGSSNADSLGALVEWDAPCADADADAEAGGCVVDVRVGISFVSAAQATANLEREASNCTLDSARKAAAAAWERELSVLELPPEVPREKRVKLVSALYRTIMSPTRYTEGEGGAYVGADTKVHAWPPADLPGGEHLYSDLSLWDTHRSQMAWLGLVKPQVAADTIRSLLQMTRQAGGVPRWPLAWVLAGCMTADHGLVSMTDALRKGLVPDMDVAEVVEWAMRQTTVGDVTTNRRTALPHYLRWGYVPTEASSTATSLTLEYAFNDWAVGRLAALAGNASVEAAMAPRRMNYRNVWVPQERLMCPRQGAAANASRAPEVFDCPRLPSAPYPLATRYTEGNAYQWRLFVPQDPHGLVALWPSQRAFAEDLETFFSGCRYLWEGGIWPFGNFLPDPFYWAGNEPDLFAVWLFLFAGRPDLTQRWSRWLVEHRHQVTPAGIPGNDDYGAMSSWLALTMLGLYPVPAADIFLLGSPSVPSATLRIPVPASVAGVDGCTAVLHIVAHDHSEDALYVARASLNGSPLQEPAVLSNDLLDYANAQSWCAGKEDTHESTLEFWMSTEPQSWGANGPSPSHWSLEKK